VKLVDERRRSRIAVGLLDYGRDNGYEPPSSHNPALRFADRNDNAFLFAVVFDQLVNAEQAWEAPYRLKRRLGHLDPRKIAHMPLQKLRSAIRHGDDGGALARYPSRMAGFIKGSAQLLADSYSGHAGRIWEDCLTATELIARLDEFPGIGLKKAHMAARILAEKGLDLDGFENINVAVDVQVRRVWERLRLVRKGAGVAEFHATASAMHPSFPGELDEPTWRIGRGWCHPSERECRANGDGDPCPLRELCISSRH
jgi:uncharacterized HhH-GPD family protein